MNQANEVVSGTQKTQAELEKYGNFALWSERDLHVGCVIGDHWIPGDEEHGKCVIVAKTTREEYVKRKTEFGANPLRLIVHTSAEYWLAVAE